MVVDLLAVAGRRSSRKVHVGLTAKHACEKTWARVAGCAVSWCRGHSADRGGTCIVISAVGCGRQAQQQEGIRWVT
jgi:hypothetical protein